MIEEQKEPVEIGAVHKDLFFLFRSETHFQVGYAYYCCHFLLFSLTYRRRHSARYSSLLFMPKQDYLVSCLYTQISEPPKSLT